MSSPNQLQIPPTASVTAPVQGKPRSKSNAGEQHHHRHVPIVDIGTYNKTLEENTKIRDYLRRVQEGFKVAMTELQTAREANELLQSENDRLKAQIQQLLAQSGNGESVQEMATKLQHSEAMLEQIMTVSKKAIAEFQELKMRFVEETDRRREAEQKLAALERRQQQQQHPVSAKLQMQRVATDAKEAQMERELAKAQVQLQDTLQEFTKFKASALERQQEWEQKVQQLLQEQEQQQLVQDQHNKKQRTADAGPTNIQVTISEPQSSTSSGYNLRSLRSPRSPTAKSPTSAALAEFSNFQRLKRMTMSRESFSKSIEPPSSLPGTITVGNQFAWRSSPILQMTDLNTSDTPQPSPDQETFRVAESSKIGESSKAVSPAKDSNSPKGGHVHGKERKRHQRDMHPNEWKRLQRQLHRMSTDAKELLEKRSQRVLEAAGIASTASEYSRYQTTSTNEGTPSTVPRTRFHVERIENNHQLEQQRQRQHQAEQRKRQAPEKLGELPEIHDASIEKQLRDIMQNLEHKLGVRM